MTRAAVTLAGVLACILLGCATPPTPSPSVAAGTPPALTTRPTSDSESGAPATPAPTLGAVPPEAALLLRDGTAVVGQLGSYTWRESGQDAPFLPGTPATAEAGRSLRFGLSFDVPVRDWLAVYATPGNGGARTTPLGVGAAPLEIDPPPPGRWVVALTVAFDAGLGEATYYWLVSL